MRIRKLIGTLTVAALAACMAYAQDSDTGEKKSGCSKSQTDKAAAKSHCGDKSKTDAEAVAAKCETKKDCGTKEKCDSAKARKCGVPVMSYRVGETTTCCPDEAAKLADGKEGAIEYIVGEKTFAKKAEAQKAYMALLEGHLGEITTVRFVVGEEDVACPMTAKSMADQQGKPLRYRLASYDFESMEAAESVAKSARQAADAVSAAPVADAQKPAHCGADGAKASAATTKSGCASDAKTVASAKTDGQKNACGSAIAASKCDSAAAEAACKSAEAKGECCGGAKPECAPVASCEVVMAKIEAALAEIEKAAKG